MTILITGGARFIGSHLADRLAAGGVAVRVLDDLSSGRPENLPKGAELIVGDVADGETVQRASHRVEAIFHLAAITSNTRALTDRTRTRQVNATGTAHVLEAAAAASGRAPIPVVYASSAAVSPVAQVLSARTLPTASRPAVWRCECLTICPMGTIPRCR
jgi:UDP-glucose 4-epimerase